MPYYRRRYRNYRKYGTRRRRRPVTGAQYKTMRKIALKEIQNTAEKKVFDIRWDNANISLTPAFYEISNISAGNSSSTRIGLQVYGESILYRFQFVVGDATNLVRMVIFQWKPDDADHAPNWLDMFQFETAGLPVSNSDIMSPLSYVEGDKGNFKVLVNKIFTLSTEYPTKVVTGFIKGGYKKKINYGTGVTEGPNHLYVLFVSDSSATTHPQVSGFTRLTFTDT